MSGLDITERRLPQDGRIQRRIEGRDVDFRVSTLPTIYGEKVTIRILDKSRLKLEIEQLGFSEHNLTRFQHLIARPFGLVLVAGPTGSGKTTTLYSAMSNVNAPESNLLTVENPVEFRLEGANQVEVNEKVGLTFASAASSARIKHHRRRRIRDRETAEIAVEAALTGHRPEHYTHGNAVGTIERLIDMDVERFLIASSLAGAVSQRLVRRSVVVQGRSTGRSRAAVRAARNERFACRPGCLRGAAALRLRVQGRRRSTSSRERCLKWCLGASPPLLDRALEEGMVLMRDDGSTRCWRA